MVSYKILYTEYFHHDESAARTEAKLDIPLTIIAFHAEDLKDLLKYDLFWYK